MAAKKLTSYHYVCNVCGTPRDPCNPKALLRVEERCGTTDRAAMYCFGCGPNHRPRANARQARVTSVASDG